MKVTSARGKGTRIEINVPAADGQAMNLISQADAVARGA